MKNKRIGIIIASATVVALASIGFLGIESKKNKEYNTLLSQANSQMDSGNIDEAKELYNKSMSIKKEPTVLSKLDEIKEIEIQKVKIKEASDLYANNDYDGALNILNNISATSNVIKSEVESIKLNIDKSIKEEELEAEKKIEEEKRIKLEKELEAEKKAKLEAEKNAKLEAEKKNNQEKNNTSNNEIIANKNNNNDKVNSSLEKSYKFRTNISSSQRSQKPNLPYVTYGEALDRVARDYFSKFKDSGEDIFISINPCDGSFFATVFKNKKSVREYEINGLNGNIVMSANVQSDDIEFYANGDYSASITIK